LKLLPEGDKMFKKPKKHMKKVVGLAATGVVLGGSSMALGSLGGATAAHSQAAIGHVSGVMPVAGRLVGTGMILGAMKPLMKKVKSKKGLF
jgi:hypothetical protein